MCVRCRRALRLNFDSHNNPQPLFIFATAVANRHSRRPLPPSPLAAAAALVRRASACFLPPPATTRTSTPPSSALHAGCFYRKSDSWYVEHGIPDSKSRIGCALRSSHIVLEYIFGCDTQRANQSETIRTAARVRAGHKHVDRKLIR